MTNEFMNMVFKTQPFTVSERFVSVAHRHTLKKVFGPGSKDKASQHNIFLCDLVTVD